MIRFGKLTETTIGFDFDGVSRDCPMKCDFMRLIACGLMSYKEIYPYKCDCNETNCILMHLLRVIGPMLLK